MDISQEAVLSMLIEEGGKIKNSELLGKFRDKLNCSDPAEKKRNRDLFKTFVNNIAVVKEVEDAKYIVLKKHYRHLLNENVDENSQNDEGGKVHPDNVRLHPASEDNEHRAQFKSGKPEALGPNTSEDPAHPNIKKADISPAHSPTKLSSEGNMSADLKVKRSLQFVTPVKSKIDDIQQQGPVCAAKTVASTHKHYALPLRMPQMSTAPNAQDKMLRERLDPANSTLQPQSSPRCKRSSSTANMASSNSPQLRKHCKGNKPADELRYTENVPLEVSEHQWLVASATDRWGLLYGLLLNDIHLVDKRDFISGFTALHWAAKSGNSDMLCKIIDLSRQSGKGVDVNARSYAGYTPLHIAAIHDRQAVINLLVSRYGADRCVRDNDGKKAHHYLHKDTSAELWELLGPTRTAQKSSEPQKSLEYDAHKHANTISRLFQPATSAHKKKTKLRGSFRSLAEETRVEHSPPTHRVRSDVFS